MIYAVARQRSYVDACASAHALDLIGERWALLVVREMLLGPKRFTDLRAGIPDLSPNVLGQRLRELEALGIVARRTLPPPAASKVYELTSWGYELEAVVIALGRWGARSPGHPRDGNLSVDSLALALKADFEASRAGGLDVEYEVRLGDQALAITIGGGAIDVRLGSALDPVSVLTTDTATMASLLWGGLTIADAIAQGGLVVRGSRPAAKRLLGLFPLPQPFTMTGS